MTAHPHDWSRIAGLYAIVDLDACRGRDPLWLASEILAGGCAVLQLRSKNQSDRERLTIAHRLKEKCARAGVPFVMNDRVDLALVCEADALHLGQDDLSYDEARRIAPELPIGLSTHGPAQLQAALAHPLAYVAFGPVFQTASKANPDPVVGLERLAQIARTVGSTRLVAIGGIRLESAAEVHAAGAQLGAVIGELAAAEDPREAAAELHRILRGGTP